MKEISQQLFQWMREAFPQLNQSLEEIPSSVGIDFTQTTAYQILHQQALYWTQQYQPYVRSHIELLVDIEDFNYLAMIYSAISRHHVRFLEATIGTKQAQQLPETLNDLSLLLQNLAQTLDILPRFLSAPYLLHNPYDESLKRATFLPWQSESIFLEANRKGTLAYEKACYLLLLLYQPQLLQENSPPISLISGGLQNQAVQQLNIILNQTEPQISDIEILKSQMIKIIVNVLKDITKYLKEAQYASISLMNQLSVEDFYLFRKYYDPVTLYAKSLENSTEFLALGGVNAGDQPWTYMIDLLLGVGPPETRLKRAQVKKQYLTDPHQNILDDFIQRYESSWLQIYQKDHTHILIDTLFDHVLYFLNKQLHMKQNHHILPKISFTITAQEEKLMLQSLLDVFKMNALSSKAHWALVHKFIIQPANQQTQEHVGTSGESVDWLKKLDHQRSYSEVLLSFTRYVTGL